MAISYDLSAVNPDESLNRPNGPATYDGLLAELKSRKWPTFSAGTGQVKTFCPICEGDESNSPSFTITRARNGKALLYCFKDESCGLGDSGHRDRFAVMQVMEAFRETEVPAGAIRRYRSRNKRGQDPLKAGATEVARYDYGNGRIKVRYKWQDDNGVWDKDFRWKNKGGKGELIYRQPTMDELTNGVVYVVEGEKDVDTLRRAGLVATCTSEGSWPNALARKLVKAKAVVVLRDYDEKGGRKRDAALAAFDDAGVPAFPIDLPGLKERPSKGKDVSDWLAGKGTVAKLKALAAKAQLAAQPAKSKRKTRSNEKVSFNHTDVGNARRMAEMYQDKVFFCPQHKAWYIWNGKIWERDESLEIKRLAQHVPEAMHMEAMQLEGDERKSLRQHAMRSEHHRALLAMIDEARALLAVKAWKLNTDPYLFCVENGTLNLKTGKLQAHAPEDLITLMAPAEFHPNAKDPRWEQVLDRFVRPDEGKEEFLQRATFASITGTISDKAFINLFDELDGNTGKTTFVESLLAMVGPYGTIVNAQSFLSNYRGGSQIRSDLGDCDGKRIVVSSEIPSGKKLDVELMKKLTGGVGKYRFERKRENSYENTVTFTIWLDGNNVAKARVEDSPLFDRWKLTPFKHRITKPDKKWVERAVASPEYRAAVLAWAMRARVAWWKNGIGSAPSVEVATAEVRAEMDPIAWFWKEECRFGEHTKARPVFATTQELHQQLEYCCRTQSGRGHAINRADFVTLLKTKDVRPGTKRVGGRTTKGWFGVRLRKGG